MVRMKAPLHTTVDIETTTSTPQDEVHAIGDASPTHASPRFLVDAWQATHARLFEDEVFDENK